MSVAGLVAAWRWLRTLPEIVWWLAALIVLVVVFLVWDRIDDRAAVAEAEAQRGVVTGQARERSAEEAIVDAFARKSLRDRRDAAIAEAAETEAAKPPAERATTPAQTVALNCAIAREDYTAAELATMREYQEHCR